MKPPGKKPANGCPRLSFLEWSFGLMPSRLGCPNVTSAHCPHPAPPPKMTHVLARPLFFPPGNVSTRGMRVKISSGSIRQSRLFDSLNQSPSRNRNLRPSTIPQRLGNSIILNEYTRLTCALSLPIIPTNRALARPPKPWPERQVLRHPTS